MRTENFNPRPFVLDTAATSELRARAKQNDASALKAAARQFEGLMLQMLLKSMRSAIPQDGLLDNDQTRFFTSIMDQQLAQDLASRGSLGFADMIEKQLGRNLAASDSKDDPLASLQMQSLVQEAMNMGANFSGGAGRIRTAPAGTEAPLGAGGSQDFVKRIWPHAVEASKMLGVPAQFVVAHSALESGWGKNEILMPDGSSSHNLFGIKAGKSWTGPSVEIQTTEYENGVPKSVRAKFRVYGTYAEAFQDYAGLLRDKARFSAVVGQRDGMGFARALQDSGYATDPLYADKLNRIIGGATLKQALSG